MRGRLSVIVVALGVFATPGMAGVALAASQPVEVSYRRMVRPDIEVFMAVDAKPGEIAAVRRAIRRNVQIDRYAFLDKRAAYREFSRIFRRNSELVHNVKPADLPASFRVDFVRGAHAGPWTVGIGRFPGVDEAARPAADISDKDAQEILKLCTDHDFVYELYMRVGATPQEVDAVRSAIEREPGATVVEFLDQEDAMREFRRLYAGNKDVLAAITAMDLPTAFRIRIARSEELRVVPFLRSLTGVDSVDSPSSACDAVKGLRPLPK